MNIEDRMRDDLGLDDVTCVVVHSNKQAKVFIDYAMQMGYRFGSLYRENFEDGDLIGVDFFGYENGEYSDYAVSKFSDRDKYLFDSIIQFPRWESDFYIPPEVQPETLIGFEKLI